MATPTGNSIGTIYTMSGAQPKKGATLLANQPSNEAAALNPKMADQIAGGVPVSSIYTGKPNVSIGGIPNADATLSAGGTKTGGTTTGGSGSGSLGGIYGGTNTGGTGSMGNPNGGNSIGTSGNIIGATDASAGKKSTTYAMAEEDRYTQGQIDNLRSVYSKMKGGRASPAASLLSPFRGYGGPRGTPVGNANTTTATKMLLGV